MNRIHFLLPLLALMYMPVQGRRVAAKQFVDERLGTEDEMWPLTSGETGSKCCCYHWGHSKIVKNPEMLRGFCPAEYCAMWEELSDPGDICTQSKHRMTCWKQARGTSCSTKDTKEQVKQAADLLTRYAEGDLTQQELYEAQKDKSTFATALSALRVAGGWSYSDSDAFTKKTAMEAASPDNPNVYNQWRHWKFGSQSEQVVDWPWTCDAECYESETKYKCLLSTYTEDYLEGDVGGLSCETAIQIGDGAFTRLCRFDDYLLGVKAWTRLGNCPHNLLEQWPETKIGQHE